MKFRGTNLGKITIPTTLDILYCILHIRYIRYIRCIHTFKPHKNTYVYYEICLHQKQLQIFLGNHCLLYLKHKFYFNKTPT